MRIRAAAAAGHLRRVAGTAVGAARAPRIGRRTTRAIADAALASVPGPGPAPATTSRVRPLGRQPPEHGQLLPRGELAELADAVRPVPRRRCWRVGGRRVGAREDALELVEAVASALAVGGTSSAHGACRRRASATPVQY